MGNLLVKYDPETLVVIEVVREDTIYDEINNAYEYQLKHLHLENTPHLYFSQQSTYGEVCEFVEEAGETVYRCDWVEIPGKDYSYIVAGYVLTESDFSEDQKLSGLVFRGERLRRFQVNRINFAHSAATGHMRGNYKDFYMDAYYFGVIEEVALQDAVDHGLLTNEDLQAILTNQFGREIINKYSTSLF